MNSQYSGFMYLFEYAEKFLDFADMVFDWLFKTSAADLIYDVLYDVAELIPLEFVVNAIKDLIDILPLDNILGNAPLAYLLLGWLVIVLCFAKVFDIILSIIAEIVDIML